MTHHNQLTLFEAIGKRVSYLTFGGRLKTGVLVDAGHYQKTATIKFDDGFTTSVGSTKQITILDNKE